MIVGHLGVALGAKSIRRAHPLLWLTVATYAPDIVDVVIGTVTGACTRYGEWSHALPCTIAIAATSAAICLVLTHDSFTAAAVAVLVLLHVPPDYLTGHKLLWSGGPIIGLRLYDRPLVEFFIEVPLIVGGWWMLRRSRGAVRWLAPWPTLAFLLTVQGAANASRTRVRGLKPGACPVEVASWDAAQRR